MRYKLQLPVIFRWNDGTEHTEGGFTSEVALDSTMILSSHCPPVGSHVRVELLIPSPVKSGEELRVECLGKVIRIIQQAGCNSFVVHGVFNDDHLMRQISV
jgi:hypothetical protein